MRFGGTEAFVLDDEAQGYVQRRSQLVSVEGGRLDAMARRGVSSSLVGVVARVATLAVTLFVVGSMSIALTSGAVGLLQGNVELSSQIKEVKVSNDDLRIECSLLSRAERISRIATQNLGMVYANKAEIIDLG